MDNGVAISYPERFLKEVSQISSQIDLGVIEKMIAYLQELKFEKGRLFFLGVGGSAANCSHAVNDFRKIAGIETYCPTDNVAELTARTNDDGWDTSFSNWLKVSNLGRNDAVFVLSVGGGNPDKKVSMNIVRALDYAGHVGAKIFGIVGRDGGYTAKLADACVIVPTLSPDTVTPHAESWQAVLWHMIVTDPRMSGEKNVG